MKKSDKLIVLDIDETLFFCDYLSVVEMITDDIDYMFYDIEIDRTFATIKRPYVDEFLNYIKENFEYGIYTAASEDYAKEHMKNLNLSPKFLLSNKNCTIKTKYTGGWGQGEQYALKKLSKLKKYADISKMIAIDDKWESYIENYGNLIKVNPFKGEKDDTTLKKLINYLEDLKNVDNIRKVEKRGWMNKY